MCTLRFAQCALIFKSFRAIYFSSAWQWCKFLSWLLVLYVILQSWRRIVTLAVAQGTSCAAMGASLAYYDQYRRARLPANLVQAQRDFFGKRWSLIVNFFSECDTQWFFFASSRETIVWMRQVRTLSSVWIKNAVRNSIACGTRPTLRTPDTKLQLRSALIHSMT